jgi:hypothetical protein
MYLNFSFNIQRYWRDLRPSGPVGYRCMKKKRKISKNISKKTP